MELTPEALLERPFSAPVSFGRSENHPALAPAARQVSLRQQLGVLTLAWMFGSVWSATTTGEPLTLFAQKLGASNFQFGLLTALPFIASLAALPGSLLVEWTGRRKGIFLAAFYLQRAMWFVIAAAPLWLVGRYGRSGGPAALWMFLGLMLAMYTVGAGGGPAWMSWMADLVPSRLNGKYFSRRRQWGNLTAIPAAIFVGWFLDRCAPAGDMAVLRWCALLFLASAVCGLSDIHLFQYVPNVPGAPQRGMRLIRALREPLRNPTFLRYSAFVGVLTFAVNLLGQFATLYLLEQIGVGNMAVQMILVVAPMLAQLMVLGVWGRAADRLGKRPLLMLASIGLVPVGLGWCFVTPGTVWLGYLLAALGAALWSGVEVVNLNLVLESSGRGGRAQGGSSFAAINGVIINICGCLGGLTAGVIAQLLRDWHWQPVAGLKSLSFYDVLFVASALVRALSVAAFIPLLHEPTARRTREAVRFMAVGLTAVVLGVAIRPARLICPRRRDADVSPICKLAPVPSAEPLRKCA